MIINENVKKETIYSESSVEYYFFLNIPCQILSAGYTLMNII